MQFVPFEEDIEISGQSVRAVMDGFNTFAVLGSAYLLDEGIGRPNPRGLAEVDPHGWYSQRSWLLCLQQIGKQLGDGLLMQIGAALPRCALFPEGIPDLIAALRSVDVAYHMNHRKNGRPLYEPESGRMVEGIGHYACEPVPHQRKILCQCETPHPCAFDRGLLTAMAQRYESNARLVHDYSGICRSSLGERCTYVITW